MKKLILLMTVTAVVLSCNKKDTEISQSNNDSLNTVEAPASVEPTVEKSAIAEYTPAELSQVLQTKNDTLYVTNFFATWCPPCVREIPHFKEKMDELKNQPVKFIFVSLDEKSDWNSKVPAFADQQGIRNQTILLDGSSLDGTFFSSNFQTWKGESIPFTFFRKGDKTEEAGGSMSKEQLENILSKFAEKQSN